MNNVNAMLLASRYDLCEDRPVKALIHGLNRQCYSIVINYRKNELEENMLPNLHKKKWTDGLTLQRFDFHSKTNEQTVQEMLRLAVKYNKAVQEKDELPPKKLAIATWEDMMPRST